VQVHDLKIIEKSQQITFIQPLVQTKSLSRPFYAHAGKNHIKEFGLVAFS